MKLKSKDIAKVLGVSPATVSLVLNNKPGISEDTRIKVIHYLEEHGYNTSHLHYSEDTAGKIIQFIIYKKHGKVVCDTPFFSELIESINRAAREDGYHLTITYIDEVKDNIPLLLDMIKQNSPSGLLVLATEMTSEDINILRKLNLPILLLDSQFDDQDIDTVCINNGDGVYKAVDYLVSLEHKSIGYLHSNVWIYNFEQRMSHFKKYMHDKGLTLGKEQFFNLEPTVEGAYRDMKKLLKERKDIPTAFFADNDIIAFGAIRALKESGYNIPDDISVIGFDDTPFCELLTPKLTTIRVYKQHMAVTAVKRLIASINASSICIQKTFISTELIKRESVK